MKRILCFCLAFVLTVAVCGCGSGAPDSSLEQVSDRKVIIMGFDNSFEPMGFEDSKGTYFGYDIDIGREIAKRLGVTLNLQVIKPETSGSELINRTVDFLGNSMSASKQQEKEFKYSNTIFKNAIVAVVMADSEYKGFSDLKGKSIAAVEGSLSMAALDENKTLKTDSKIIKVQTSGAALAELLNRRADAMVVDESFARYQISRGVNIKILENKIKAVDYKLVFRKADKSLVKKINKILGEMKKEGKLSEISNKWFGDDFAAK